MCVCVCVWFDAFTVFVRCKLAGGLNSCGWGRESRSSTCNDHVLSLEASASEPAPPDSVELLGMVDEKGD